MEIVGVVKDFNFESLQQKVGPMFFILIPEETQKIMAKIEAGKEKEAVGELQSLYDCCRGILPKWYWWPSLPLCHWGITFPKSGWTALPIRLTWNGGILSEPGC